MQRMDKNRYFHAIEALTVATNEVVSLGLVQKYEIFATAPIAQCPYCGAVVITTLVHHKHIVLCLLVPKCCHNLQTKNLIRLKDLNLIRVCLGLL